MPIYVPFQSPGTLRAHTGSEVPLTISGALGQTARYLRIDDSAGSEVFWISAQGNVYLTGSAQLVGDVTASAGEFVRLTGTNITGSSFDMSVARIAVITGTDIRFTTMTGGTVSGTQAQFAGIQAITAALQSLSGSTYTATSATLQELSSSVALVSQLSASVGRVSVLTGTLLSGSDAKFQAITGSFVSGSDAKFTAVTGTQVSGSDSKFTSITGTFFTGTDAKIFTLTGTLVSGTDAKFSEVTGTHVSGTDARFTWLTGTNITGSDARLSSLTASVTGPLGRFTEITGTRVSGTDLRAASASIDWGHFTWLTGTNITGSSATITGLTASEGLFDVIETTYIGAGLMSSSRGIIPVLTASLMSGSEAYIIQIVAEGLAALRLTGTHITGSDALLTSLTSVSGTVTRLTGTWLSGSSLQFGTITGSLTSGTQARFGEVTGSAVSGTIARFTYLTGTHVSGSNLKFEQVDLGSANVRDDLTVLGDLAVSGNFVVSGSLVVTSSLSSSGDLSALSGNMAGDLIVQRNLYVSGTSIVQDFNARSGSFAGDLAASGSLTVARDIGARSGTLLGDLGVAGTASVGGLLRVTGGSTLASVSGTSAQFTTVTASSGRIDAASIPFLTGTDAKFFTLTGTLITGSDLKFTSVSGAFVSGTDAKFTCLTGSLVSGTDAKFSRLTGTAVSGTSAAFEAATLRSVDSTDTRVAILTATLASGTDLRFESGAIRNLSGDTASYGTLTGTLVSGTDAKFTTLTGTLFLGSDAKLAVLTGTAVTGSAAAFDSAAIWVVSGSDLKVTTLTGTLITGSDAKFGTVSGSRVSGSDAKFTTLTGTLLSGTDAKFTYLTGTLTSGSEARFSTAVVSGEVSSSVAKHGDLTSSLAQFGAVAIGTPTALSPLHVGGAARVDSDLVVGGNLVVNGTSSWVNAQNLNIQDPIVSVGGGPSGTFPVVDDGKDRGVQFFWHDGATGRYGFFGWDSSTRKFTFVPSGTLVNEIVTGSVGPFDLAGTALDLRNGAGISVANSSGSSTITNTGALSFNARTGEVVLLEGDLAAIIGDMSASLSTSGDLFARNLSGTWTGEPIVKAWQGRTGAVVLLVSDISGVLGYLPVSPSGSITGSTLLSAQTGRFAVLSASVFSGSWAGDPIVNSWNSRTGAVSLTNADVSGALGYQPVHPSGSISGSVLLSAETGSFSELTGTLVSGTDAKFGSVTGTFSGSWAGDPLVNSFNDRTGAVALASSDVSGALGYQPVSPSGSLVGSPSVQAATGSFDVLSGTLISGTWTGEPIVKSFNSRTGAVALANDDVSGALGYQPVSPSGSIAGATSLSATSGSFTHLTGTSVSGSAATFSSVKINGNDALTGSLMVTLSGDVLGSGSNSIQTTLKATGSAGTYTKVTTDAYGRVISGTDLSSANVSAALGYQPVSPSGSITGAGILAATTGAFTYLTGTNVSGTDAKFASVTGTFSGTWSGDPLVNSWNGRTGAVSLTNEDISGALGYQPATLSSSISGAVIQGATGRFTYLTGTFISGTWQGDPLVNSFNTRTGAVSLTNADVSGALGYQPASLSSSITGAPTGSFTYLTGTYISGTWQGSPLVTAFNTRTGTVSLTNADVSSALGYQPASLSSSITGAPTGSFTYLTGTYISGTWQGSPLVTSFNNRTGGVALTNADVSGALGYQPVSPSGTISGSTLVQATSGSFSTFSAGVALVSGTIFGGNGVRITGSSNDSATWTGPGLELFHSANTGYVIGYDRTAAVYLPLRISGLRTDIASSGAIMATFSPAGLSLTGAFAGTGPISGTAVSGTSGLFTYLTGTNLSGTNLTYTAVTGTNVTGSIAQFAQISGSGGYFAGNVNIGGTLSATAKSFKIDHPTKKGKKLVYGVAEGPEHSIFVRGRLKGGNTIELPDYWMHLIDLNSITVQLTPVGRWPQWLRVKSVSGTRITVGRFLPTPVDCYYLVQATRADVPKLVTEE